MSGPKPAVLLLVLALVAIVAFFVVGVGVGSTNKKRADPQALKERFLPKPASVRSDEVKGNPCRSLLPPGARCEFQVLPSSRLLRALELQTQDEVHVGLLPASQDREIAIDLKPARLGQSKKVELSIDRKGATLQVLCRKPASPGPAPIGCTVQVSLAPAESG